MKVRNVTDAWWCQTAYRSPCSRPFQHLLKALDGRLSIQTSGADLNLLLNDIRESKVSLGFPHVMFSFLPLAPPKGD